MREWTRGPSHRPRSAHCPETDALAPRQTLPVRCARAMVRGCAPSRAPRSISNQRVSPRAPEMLVTQRLAGYNGFSWELMGIHGKWRIFGAFRRASVALFLACSSGQTLWISLWSSESLRLERCKFGDEAIEIMHGFSSATIGVDEIGVGDDDRLSPAEMAVGGKPISADDAAAVQLPGRNRDYMEAPQGRLRRPTLVGCVEPQSPVREQAGVG